VSRVRKAALHHALAGAAFRFPGNEQAARGIAHRVLARRLDLSARVLLAVAKAVPGPFWEIGRRLL
jgi:hypothetical protein